MPYKANEPRRHKIPRARYKVRNWLAYDRALQQRGSLTVWVTPEALAAWHPPRTGQRGRHHLLAVQPWPGARDGAGASPGERADSRRDRRDRPEGLRRGRVAGRE